MISSAALAGVIPISLIFVNTSLFLTNLSLAPRWYGTAIQCLSGGGAKNE
jgi:hypothetical protein